MADYGESEEDTNRFFVAVHVGAGFHSPTNEKAYRRVMKRACLAAAVVLRTMLYGSAHYNPDGPVTGCFISITTETANYGKGGCLDAVSAAIQVLEDVRMNFKAAMVGSGPTSSDVGSEMMSLEAKAQANAQPMAGFLPDNSTGSLQITLYKLNGKNYLEWSQTELNLFEEEDWENPNDSARYKNKIERGRVFVFLAGLNKELDEVRGRIMGRKPLPPLREVFLEVRREEARRYVMLKNILESKPEMEGFALAVRGAEKQRPWCYYCRKPWHTCENCWKLHGKRAYGKKKQGSDNKLGGAHESRALHMNHSDPKQQSSSESFPFTKEQMEHLQKLFQSQSLGNSNPSCALADLGIVPIGTLACTKSNDFWILDSGATDHMTSISQYFSSYTPSAGNQKIKIADGSFATVAGKGLVPISQSITLTNVLHDLTWGKMIGDAKQDGGLYLFNEGSDRKTFVGSQAGENKPNEDECVDKSDLTFALVPNDALSLKEDDPTTNAGRGSNLTEHGHVECDASIMDGCSGAFGAVGAVRGVRNAIEIARNLAKEQTTGSSLLGRIPPMSDFIDAVWPDFCIQTTSWSDGIGLFLAGEGAREWGKSKGITMPVSISEAELWLVTEKAKSRWIKYKSMLADAEKKIECPEEMPTVACGSAALLEGALKL
ncbi:hypothetical protein ZIOFF_071336 [Zingiber officinale]|uniref:Retrovirus-related Pol polyprotein from transposon TNT 1-94-like beta-barrel domain-containing protein n=1 Tax=Zingiber officinale TaxID=94328 RepID=A0A8J5CUM4_ZINOF|nr:hypothetical protein ZIOFF_071336 [Zingiber officinale]